MISFFYFVYLILVLSFVWLTFILLFKADFGKKKYSGDFDKPFSVIIPVFNEPVSDLEESIKSIISSRGVKEVIVVNDGSSINYRDLCFKYGVKYLHNDINKGKRFVQAQAVKVAKYDFIVSTDSDVIFDKDTCVKLLFPLLDSNIGLTTGVVKLKNGKGILFDIQNFQFAMAFEIGRKALGGNGFLNCGSGALLGFRKKDYIDLCELYLSDNIDGFKFFPIAFGEDRYLTNLFIKFNFKTVFVEDAICFTSPVESWKKYYKQQLRWTISGITQGIYSLSFMFKNNKLLWFYNFLYLVLPFISIALFVFSLFNSFSSIFVIVFGSIASTYCKDIYVLLKKPELWSKGIFFSLYHFFIIQPLWIIALFRINEKKWMTR